MWKCKLCEFSNVPKVRPVGPLGSQIKPGCLVKGLHPYHESPSYPATYAYGLQGWLCSIETRARARELKLGLKASARRALPHEEVQRRHMELKNKEGACRHWCWLGFDDLAHNVLIHRTNGLKQAEKGTPGRPLTHTSCPFCAMNVRISVPTQAEGQGPRAFPG